MLATLMRRQNQRFNVRSRGVAVLPVVKGKTEANTVFRYTSTVLYNTTSDRYLYRVVKDFMRNRMHIDTVDLLGRQCLMLDTDAEIMKNGNRLAKAESARSTEKVQETRLHGSPEQYSVTPSQNTSAGPRTPCLALNFVHLMKYQREGGSHLGHPTPHHVAPQQVVNIASN
nr:hypothetical protein CFP56_32370 [Quercus suber]